MSVLVHAEVDGDRLSPDDVLHESLLILVGGDETTRHVISGGIEQLLLHPDQRQLLVDDPAKITVAVEEMLRWVTPIKNMCRTVTHDTEFMGQPMTAGPEVHAACSSRRTATRRGSTTRSGSTSSATRTSTSRSASARTSASARRWPGSS